MADTFPVLILGAGKIGRAIAAFLKASGHYTITVADIHPATLDRLKDDSALQTILLDRSPGNSGLSKALQGQRAVLSALPFDQNADIARQAVQAGVSYFDLTEDVRTTRQVRDAAEACPPGCIVMPQCGLAPGFISIAANELANRFDTVDRIHMRVGALPQFPTNMLRYNLTWSTEGLINEYCNACEAIHNGEYREVLPLEGYETFSLDGVRYEAFNTSGGLGTLCETWDGRVRELNYRTMRYPGHLELMRFLLRDLAMARKQDLLKELLEDAIPVTYQDVVIVFVSVSGMRDGQLVQITDARKIYHQEIDEVHWGAIQVTTAGGICGVLDLHRQGRLPSQGFVRQEDVRLDDFLGTPFGQCYAKAARMQVGEA